MIHSPWSTPDGSDSCIEVILPSGNAASHAIPHKNFNECPHCVSCGRDGFVSRLSEGFPMISRSDGASFHLVLGDPPRPFPAEREGGSTACLSVCFLYQSGPKHETEVALTLVDSPAGKGASLYRSIERVADFLSSELLASGKLRQFYDLRERPVFDGYFGLG